MEEPKEETKRYTPRADYAWVPAYMTAAFVLSFIVMIFAPMFFEQPDSVIKWLSEMKGDIILFIGLCLGFFLKDARSKP